MRSVFDIRNVIAALLGSFGNVNLWTGIALTVVAAACVAWAVRRPIQDDTSDES